MRPGIAVAAVLLLASLPPAVRATEPPEEERPQIFLEKKVYSDAAGGKRRFYEAYTVEKGENLWEIMGRSAPLTPETYAERLREFRRTNPSVADPSLLLPGQKILVPSGTRERDDGRTVAYEVRKGDTLTGILASRGVPGKERRKYLEAIRAINPSVKDVNRILAGKTLRLPTEAYFGGEKEVASRPVPDTAPEGAASAGVGRPPGALASPVAPAGGIPPSVELSASPPATRPLPEPPHAAPLTRDVSPVPGQDALAAGKPEAELLAPKASSTGVSLLETGKKEPERETVTPPSRSPYRGLLSDLFNALGEKWVERGTLYLPLPSGGDVVLRLADFPAVRFSGGTEALIDFRGGIPPAVRGAIIGNWGSMRVVSLAGAQGVDEMIDRILSVSGYYSVKEGLERPLVIGESVSVALPARWVIQRTRDSLLSGDLVLVKKVPEKPGRDLLAVLRYARRVGIRVLPYADDPKAMEGFLVGLGEEEAAGTPVALAVPKGGGLRAVDFGLSLLGIPSKEGELLRFGEKGDGFRLSVQAERTFEAGGKKYVVDTGKFSPALRALLRDGGYAVFPAETGGTGRDVLARLMKAAGVAGETWRAAPIAGGGKEGYVVRVTGTCISLPPTSAGAARRVVFLNGKIHSAARALLRDLGVEIAEW